MARIFAMQMEFSKDLIQIIARQFIAKENALKGRHSRKDDPKMTGSTWECVEQVERSIKGVSEKGELSRWESWHAFLYLGVCLAFPHMAGVLLAIFGTKWPYKLLAMVGTKINDAS